MNQRSNPRQRVEVLCATMHQRNLDLIKNLNIQTSCIIANQSDTMKMNKEIDGCGNLFQLITTPTIGSSINRNISLTFASKEICILADDDIQYYDGYAEKLCAAFDGLPDADMIIFNMDTDSQKRKMKMITSVKRMRQWTRNPYGSVRVAFRLSSQRKFNIWFSQIFGAGLKYKSGEDSKFIRDFVAAGKVYLVPITLGKVDFSKSSWFAGYNEEYLYNAGAKTADAHTILFPWIFYYAWRYSKNTKISFWERIRWLRRGVKGFKKMQSYKENV